MLNLAVLNRKGPSTETVQGPFEQYEFVLYEPSRK